MLVLQLPHYSLTSRSGPTDDVTTRLDKSILGISVQYIEGKQSVLQNLAMKELKQRHTLSCIASTIADALTEFKKYIWNKFIA